MLVTPFTVAQNRWNRDWKYQIKDESDVIRAKKILFEHHRSLLESGENDDDYRSIKINPKDTIFDVIMQEDTTIEEFLEEDRENHIVLRDYDNPESTFLVDITNIKNAINVPLVLGKDYEIEEYQEGGDAVRYQCIKSGDYPNLSSINNTSPYFNMTIVAGWGGLIPLVELFEKIIMPPASERGQFFSYKVLDKTISPIAAISVVQYLGYPGMNRYGGTINIVSASHCQEGQEGKLVTIIKAQSSTSSTSSGGKKVKRKRHNNSRKKGGKKPDKKSKKKSRQTSLKKSRKGRGKQHGKKTGGKDGKKPGNKTVKKVLKTSKKKKTIRNYH
jgi:hypothetical protein